MIVRKMAFLIFLLLSIDGDIASNPGPTYNILKVIQGYSHQGDPKFGKSAGVQCGTCAPVPICGSHFKNVGYWSSNDIETIFEHGTRVFSLLGIHTRGLAAEKLPHIFHK